MTPFALAGMAGSIGAMQLSSGPVVCGIDGRDAHAPAFLRVAAALAEDLGRPLVVAYVASPELPGVEPGAGAGALAVPPTAGVPYAPMPDRPEEVDRVRHEAAQRIERIAEQCGVRAADVHVELGAQPADALRTVARERDAALLVVGSRGHGAVRAALLGSTSHALAGQAPCPVVVVPPDDDDR